MDENRVFVKVSHEIEYLKKKVVCVEINNDTIKKKPARQIENLKSSSDSNRNFKYALNVNNAQQESEQNVHSDYSENDFHLCNSQFDCMDSLVEHFRTHHEEYHHMMVFAAEKQIDRPPYLNKNLNKATCLICQFWQAW